MPRYLLCRYALIEEYTHAEAANAERAIELLNAGKLPAMQLADDTTETGPVRVYEEKLGEAGPDPLPLEIVSTLDERVRILREALEGMLEMHDKNFKKINWGASFLDAEAIGLLNDKPLAARAALEATKEGD